jgi:hypothetical protein
MSYATGDPRTAQLEAQQKRWSTLKRYSFGFLTVMLVAAIYWIATAGDMRTRLATQLLFGDSDQPNAAVYLAGINARFSRGTRTASLITFVEGQHGHCTVSNGGEYFCRLPYLTSICIVHSIDLRFKDQEYIDVIDAKLGADGC